MTQEINQHGGKRMGAGRKTPASPYGEKTKVMRIPESKVVLVQDWLNVQKSQGEQLTQLSSNQIFTPIVTSKVAINLYSHSVVAGFPSPADDNIEDTIDLNEHFIRKPETSFMVKVQGDSMKNAGIHHGDMLVVDKSLNPKDNDIVIAALDGELTVKRLSIKRDGTWLMPENEDFNPYLSVRKVI